MKLQSLNSFELLNKETIHMVAGGTAVAESKKKDVTSDTQDSASGDHYDKVIA